MSWTSVMGLTLMLMGAAAAEAKTALWLHIKVHDGDGSRVSINLPLSVVEAAMPLVPDEARVAGRIRIADRDLSVQDLRRLWRAVQREPEASFVTIDESSGKVRVARSGGYLLIQAADGADREGRPRRHQGERVEVRMPVAVVDALLSSADDHLNLAAAIEALARSGEGELVTVNGDNDTVRMWVDGAAEGR
jgi:hypothetical protein